MTAFLLAITLLVCAPAVHSQKEPALPAPLIVSDTQVNLRPSVTWNAQTGQFLIAWIRTKGVLDYDDGEIQSAIIDPAPELHILRQTRISRPTETKLYAPFVTVKHQPSGNRYMVLWHETKGDKRRLMYTALREDGSFERRAKRIVTNIGVLLNAPLISPGPLGEFTYIIWNELDSNGFTTKLVSFDPEKPGTRVSDILELSNSANGLFDMPRDMVLRSDGSFSLYGFRINTREGVNRLMFRRDLSVHSGLIPSDSNTTVTKRKLRTSITLDVEPFDESDLVLYNYNVPQRDLNAISVFAYPRENGGKARPSADTPTEATIFEASLLAPSVDGLAKVIWSEEREGSWSLLVQNLTSDGDLFGDPVLVAQGTQPIMAPAAAWGDEKGSILVVWSESAEDGSVTLKCRLLTIEELQ